MSKFTLTVTQGVAKVYPYGQVSDVEQVLHEGESADLEVPVGPHVEPAGAEPSVAVGQGALLQAQVDADKSAPAAGIDEDSPRDARAGTVSVTVTEGSVTLRTYEGSRFTEKLLEEGADARVELTESNRISLAVYDAAPKVQPLAA